MVELVAVISILAILSAVVMVNYTNRMSTTRDAVRMEDMHIFKYHLELTYQSENRYPAPANSMPLLFSGATIALFGELDESLSLQNFIPTQKDPKAKISYKYGTLKNGSAYQLGATLE